MIKSQPSKPDDGKQLCIDQGNRAGDKQTPGQARYPISMRQTPIEPGVHDNEHQQKRVHPKIMDIQGQVGRCTHQQRRQQAGAAVKHIGAKAIEPGNHQSACQNRKQAQGKLCPASQRRPASPQQIEERHMIWAVFSDRVDNLRRAVRGIEAAHVGNRKQFIRPNWIPV